MEVDKSIIVEVRRKRRKKKKDAAPHDKSGDNQCAEEKEAQETEQNSSDEDIYNFNKLFAKSLRLDSDDSSDEDDNFFSRNKIPLPMKVVRRKDPPEKEEEKHATPAKRPKLDSNLASSNGNEKNAAGSSKTGCDASDDKGSNEKSDAVDADKVMAIANSSKVVDPSKRKSKGGKNNKLKVERCINVSKSYSCEVVEVRPQDPWKQKPFDRLCNYCRLSFQNKKSFMTHNIKCLDIYKKKSKELPADYKGPAIYKCAWCTTEFKATDLLVIHVQQNHFNECVCNTCRKVFGSKELVVKHVESHVKRKKVYKCQYLQTCKGIKCDLTFKTAASVIRHVVSAHMGIQGVKGIEDDDDSEYEVSNQPVQDEGEISDDEIEEIFEEEKMKPEEIAKDVEKEVVDIIDIDDDDDPMDEATVKAEKQSPAKKRPLKPLDDQGPLKFLQSEIDAIEALSENARAMKLEKEIHTYSRRVQPYPTQQGYSCSHCTVGAANRIDVQRHIDRDHPLHYECIFMGKPCKSFKSSPELREHLFKVHMDRIKTPYKCRICPQSYALQSDLNCHLNRHPILPSHSRPFHCAPCHRDFASSDALQNHLRHSKKHKV